MLEATHQYIQNRTFDEIAVGDSAQLVRTLRPDDIHLFAAMSGDVNPAHVDPEFARSGQFREVVGHSMWGSTLISSLLGTEFPGPRDLRGAPGSQPGRFSRPALLVEGQDVYHGERGAGRIRGSRHRPLAAGCPGDPLRGLRRGGRGLL